MTYEELWAEFEGDRDDGFPGSFTDWMVQRLDVWEQAALRRVRSLEERVRHIQNAPTVPREQHEALQREMTSLRQQIAFERSRHAAAPNIGYARGTTQGTTAPPPGVAPGPLRGLDQIRQQGRDLRPGGISQDDLDRVVRRVLANPDDPGES